MRTGEAPQTLVITGAAELSFFFDYTDVPPVVGEYAKTASLHVESEVDMTYEANGTLFVDDRVWTDDTRCFAGRFDLDFEDGALAGRFRVP